MRRYRWLILAVALVIGAFLLWYFKNLVLYVVLALVLSLIGRPLTDLFRKIKIGRFALPDAAAAGFTMMIMYGILGLFFVFFSPILAEQIQNISKVDVKRIALSVEKPLKPVKKIAVQYHFLERGQTFWDYGQAELTTFLSGLEISNIMSSLVKFTGDIFIGIFAVSFITFFLLKERGLSYNFVMNLTPTGYEEKISTVLIHSKKLLRRYFLGVLAEQTLIGIGLWIGMTLIHADNALLIAFLGALVNVIPYVGPIIGMCFGMVLIVCSNSYVDFYVYTAPMLFKAFLLYTGLHFLDNMLLQPIIYSSSVKAHPLEIFLVILAAGIMGGVMGLLLAIPVYTLFRVMAREFLGEFKIVQTITEDIYS